LLKGSRDLAKNDESRRIFLKGGAFIRCRGCAHPARTRANLTLISKGGVKEFYEGETAKTLAAQMEKNGGLITLSDLRNYAAVERTPNSPLVFICKSSR
jgi:gamma-glutamyltranspeptidase/glutathione hydrolase